MDALDIVAIGQDLLLTAMWISGPAILVSLIVGLAVSLMQTVTSVQEQTLSFAPRIIAVGAVMVLTLPWMLRLSSEFTLRMMDRLLQVTQ
ncbi:MAG: flagellar biosynthetic protein FliQ [Planctomycetaceae bacterium]|nr:flagellar biosynthetic protein FliQ [Planctomycetaceae bacterium]